MFYFSWFYWWPGKAWDVDDFNNCKMGLVYCDYLVPEFAGGRPQIRSILVNKICPKLTVTISANGTGVNAANSVGWFI